MFKKVVTVLLALLLVSQILVPTVAVAIDVDFDAMCRETFGPESSWNWDLVACYPNDGTDDDGGGDDNNLPDFVQINVTGTQCDWPDVIHTPEVGSTFTVSAAGCQEAGYVFSHWESSVPVEFADATAVTTTFIVPEADSVINITAIFVPTTINNDVVIGINATEGESCYRHHALYVLRVGEVKSLSTCDPLPGFRFSHWESSHDAVVFVDATARSTTFVVPQSAVETGIFITAVFVPIDNITTHTVTAIGAEILVDGASIGSSGNFAPGAVVTLSAYATAGFTTFAYWSISPNIELTPDAWTDTVSFVMPESDVEISAVFVDRVFIDVHGGEVNHATPSGLYEMGSTVSITAQEPVGYRFSHWVVAPGSSVASVEFGDVYARSTSFVVPHLDLTTASIIIIAMFEPYETTPTEPPTGDDDYTWILLPEPNPTDPTDDDDYTWILLPEPNPTDPTEPDYDYVLLEQPEEEDFTWVYLEDKKNPGSWVIITDPEDEGYEWVILTEPTTLPDGMMPVVRPSFWNAVRDKISSIGSWFKR